MFRPVPRVVVALVALALAEQLSAEEHGQSRSHTLPLSDLANRGNWSVYEPMTDEFSGDTLNPAKWFSHSPGWPGRAPGLFDPSNVVVANGTLQLWARAAQRNSSWPAGFDNYTTAAVHSVANTAHGYFEVRSRSGSSCISSSWWLHFNDGKGTWTEIDVFETSGAPPGQKGCTPLPGGGRRDTLVPSHQHVFEVNGVAQADLPSRCSCSFANKTAETDCGSQAWHTANFSVSADFHVYGLEWNTTHVTFYVDGAITGSLYSPCLQQAIGMDFDRETMGSWMGEPDPELLPDVPFTIDYVRAWKSPATSPPL